MNLQHPNDDIHHWLASVVELESPQPLCGQHYMDAHIAFETASTQQTQVRHRFERELLRVSASLGRRLNILSFGCGSGLLDIPLLKHCGHLIQRYDAVDPNQHEIETFRALMSVQPNRDPLEINYYIESGERLLERSHRNGPHYDLILCSHVLYYLEDPAHFVRLSLKNLTEGGAIVIAHAPRGAMNEIAQAFWERQNVQAFYVDELDALLNAQGITFNSLEFVGLLPTSVLDDNVPQGCLILEFIIQSVWDRLSADSRAAVMTALKAASLQTLSGRMVPHPAKIYSIEQQ